MATAVMLLAGLICLGTCAVKVRDAVQHPERPALRALCVMLGVVGLAFVVTAPPVTPWISGVFGVPNSGRLLGNTLTLISAAALQAMMLYVAHRPEVARPRLRLRLIALVVVVIGMSVSLLTADTVETAAFLTVYAGYPPVVAYQLFYLSFLGLAIIDLLHLSIRYSRYASGALRWGLRLVAAGALVGVAYFGHKSLYLVDGLRHETPPGNESAVSAELAGTAGILVAVGASMPLWARYVVLPWRRVRQYLAYRRLGPLWRSLHDALPEIELTSNQAMTGGYRRWQIGLRLYRRVIEIRDAQLILRSHSDPAAADRARADAQRRGLSGDHLRAVVDAAVLVSALRALDAGEDARATAANAAEDITGETSLMSESRYLEKVAAAFHELAVPAAPDVRETRPANENEPVP
jgi:hypothetical protein